MKVDVQLYPFIGFYIGNRLSGVDQFTGFIEGFDSKGSAGTRRNQHHAGQQSIFEQQRCFNGLNDPRPGYGQDEGGNLA